MLHHRSQHHQRPQRLQTRGLMRLSRGYIRVYLRPKSQHHSAPARLSTSDNLPAKTTLTPCQTYIFHNMGLTTITAVAILAFNALTTNANFSCECDGLDAPVWDDCKRIERFSRSSANNEHRCYHRRHVRRHTTHLPSRL